MSLLKSSYVMNTQSCPFLVCGRSPILCLLLSGTPESRGAVPRQGFTFTGGLKKLMPEDAAAALLCALVFSAFFLEDAYLSRSELVDIELCLFDNGCFDKSPCLATNAQSLFLRPCRLEAEATTSRTSICSMDPPLLLMMPMM